ncbi:MAG: hypothetical protein V8R30_04770 [Clostridia bacterium]|jgi:hypothetical protein|nr:putative uncharacterized protein [Clostridium sp. CAG:273]
MSKVIKFGIGFVTGRPNICKLINNTCKHLAEQVNKSDVKIELTIFILFDLQYQFTTRIDFYGLMPDVYKNVNIKYITPEDLEEQKKILIGKEILTKKEADLFLGYGYAKGRNTIMYYALKKEIDYLLFWDDDEYPVACLKEDEDEEITWVKQDNIINTINYMKKADVALGHKCGYVSPIPYIELKEDINEDLFKDYIEAVSNEAISWEGIREQLVKYHGFRYVPKSELEESKVREIKFDGIGKWVLGSPLCLNFTHLDKIPSFYNPEGARGEDAFFSTWLENSKVIEMPVYHFHDAFLKYTNILNEKYPKKLRKIKMEDEQTTERFIKASIGWIRYKPLFIYLTDRKNYNEKIDQIREKLRISIPEVNKLFANSDLNLLLPELEKFNSSVKKDYDDYIKTDEAWKKVKKAMTENK